MQQKQPSKEEIKLMESQAIDKSEHGDRSYRKKYRKTYTSVTCASCGVFYNLRTVPQAIQDTFKREGHKKNRNPKALQHESKTVYLCKDCYDKVEKQAKLEMEKTVLDSK